MKKNSLTTALLAGLAGAAGLVTTANAVNLNPDGLGQVLIYPFYTVDGGNNTQISVVNTTNRVKAVKVRFLEARRGPRPEAAGLRPPLDRCPGLHQQGQVRFPPRVFLRVHVAVREELPD